MTSRRTLIGTAPATLAMSATGLALLAGPAGAATPTASSSTAPSPAASACDKTAWEAPVQGAPAGFAAGDVGGDYLWHDAAGFRLRVTHGNNHDQRVYSGEITSSAALRVDPVKLEKGDTLKLSANHRSLVFVFANHGYIDGVNFHTDCASTLTVANLHVGSNNLSTKQVYLGATRAHPAHIPFALHRRPVPTT